MVLDTWVQCTDLFISPALRYRRTYRCKNRCARSAGSFAEAALMALVGFMRDAKNDKFEFSYAYVYDPEKRVEASYRIVLKDGKPYLRRVQHYGDDSTPDEIEVVDDTPYGHGEVMRIAREWQDREDRFNERSANEQKEQGTEASGQASGQQGQELGRPV